MNEKTCSRSWEVEAARDGRLSEAACALLEEHVLRCEICARERRALEGLAGRLRGGLPGAPDDLSVRRLRRATLERANAAWMERGPSRERGRRLSIAAAGLAFACALVGLAWWGHLRHEGATVQVTEGTAADWSRDTSAEAQRVTLREGAIELRIKRAAEDPPFFVVVPDGEIQDVGTVFRVEVKGGVTTSIEVSEGAVVFRRPGQPEVRVEAGEHWPHSSPQAGTSAAGTAGSAGVGTAGAREPGAASATVGDEQPPGSAAGSPGGTAAPTSPAAGASTASAATGGTTGAASSPATPKGAAPSGQPTASGGAQAGGAKGAASSKPATSSGLEEDIAYLRVIALLRDGRREEARLAAKDYLRRFPNGFRRVEVAAIAR